MTIALFLKYTERTCTPQEKKYVANWLLTCSDEELDEILSDFWQTAWEPMPAEQAKQLLQKIIGTEPLKKLPSIATVQKRWWKTAIAAACLVGVITMTVLLFTGKKTEKNNVQTAQRIVEPTKQQWVHITNNEAVNKELTLEDGTIVQLADHSRLTYPNHFEAGQRTIYLEGKALFTVAKDKQRPFTVYSGTISTTALGTIFLVNADSVKQEIRVKLTEGKVVIRYKKDSVYLLPGQELYYNANSRVATVNEFAATGKAVPVKNNNTRIKPLKDISFTNAPLPDVFEQLHARYHQSIQYNKEELADLYFTGSITAHDSLDALLKIIATMNGLVIEQQATGFSVKKHP